MDATGDHDRLAALDALADSATTAYLDAESSVAAYRATSSRYACALALRAAFLALAANAAALGVRP